MTPSEVNLGAEAKVAFADPFYAEADISYAVVLSTNSAKL